MNKLKQAYKHIRQWLKSKTINFGLLLQLVSAYQLYINQLDNALYTFLISTVVIYLRFKTTQPVDDK